jgi:hypothetical protein|uniref:Uncharacterized protein n=1 Tax=Hydrogenobacter sp. TaxID=2152829 RepID=A0A7C2VBF4_9AQUI
MKVNKFIPLLGLLAIGISNCGGGGGSGSLDFNSVVVSILGANPNPLESDVIIRKKETRYVWTNYPACDTLTPANDVCTGTTFKSDVITITFRSQTIRNAQGQPVTSNPSPVYVEKYRISFSNCIPGTYESSVGATIPPDTDTQISIQPITFDMKKSIALQGQYIYISNDGCGTIFTVYTYPNPCNAIANIEFYLVEQYSGKRKTISYPINVRLADITTQDDECNR